MKRSEVKKKLSDRIYKHLYGTSLSNIEDYTVIHKRSCEMAEELLFLIEEEGMLPPAYWIDWDTEDEEYVHEWEPEDEEK